MAVKIRPSLKKYGEVEVAHGARSTEVRQPEDEDGAEGEPHPRVVDRSSEGAGVAARHLPGDLRAGPRLGDAAARVHLRLDDLSGIGQRRPDIHLPSPGFVVERPLLRQRLGRIALHPVGDLGEAEDGLDRLLLGQRRLRRLLARDERHLDEVPFGVIDGALRRGEGVGSSDEEGRRDGG
jgi:hypothetical protein